MRQPALSGAADKHTHTHLQLPLRGLHAVALLMQLPQPWCQATIVDRLVCTCCCCSSFAGTAASCWRGAVGCPCGRRAICRVVVVVQAVAGRGLWLPLCRSGRALLLLRGRPVCAWLRKTRHKTTHCVRQHGISMRDCKKGVRVVLPAPQALNKKPSRKMLPPLSS